MTDQTILAVCKEISALATSNTNRLSYNNASEINHERVLFSAILEISSEKKCTVLDTIEIIKTYLAHAKWNGILVRDRSFASGNPYGGDTWALVLYNGIFASFAGGPFQSIFEPDYEIHDKINDEIDEDLNSSLDQSDPALLAERRRAISDKSAIDFKKSCFGIPFHDGQNDVIATLPEGFSNPLMIESFANGGVNQEVIAASNPLLNMYRVRSASDWAERVSNNQGTLSGFDILTSAAIQFHAGRPVVRELRSWSEKQYSVVRDSVLLVSAAWPNLLSGNLLFASARNRSWIVIDEEADNLPLFERENWPTNVAISRVLAILSGLQTFRGMTCPFDLSNEGEVNFFGPGENIIRSIVTAFAPSAEETLSAKYRLVDVLTNLGFDSDRLQETVASPVLLADLVDPGRFIIKKGNGSEQRLFENGSSIKRKRHNSVESPIQSPFRPARDPLYRALNGDGNSDTYLSDGLWLSPDGHISDKGR